MTQYIWSLSCHPGVQVEVRSAQFYRPHEACWLLVKSRLIRKFLWNLEHIFCSVQEMESLVPGWSVPLRRWPLCQWWRAEWQPRSTLCQSSSLLGPNFQFPLKREIWGLEKQVGEKKRYELLDDQFLITHRSNCVLLSFTVSDEVASVHALFDLRCSLSQTLIQVGRTGDVDIIH